MKSIYALVRKDVKGFMSDRVAVGLVFLVPMIMIVIFGAVFGGGGDDASPIRLIVINHSSSPVALEIVKALDSAKALSPFHTYKTEGDVPREVEFNDSSAAAWVKDGKVTAAFIIPSNAISDSGTGLRLKLLYDPKNEMETALLQGVLQQTIYTKTPGLFTSLLRSAAQWRLKNPENTELARRIHEAVKEYFPESKFDIDRWVNDTSAVRDSSSADSAQIAGISKFFGNLVKIDTEQLVGQQLANPAVTRSIGGWAIMFVLFSLTGASRAFVEEYDTGTLHRLLTAPITRGEVLLSKYLYNWLLGIVQLLVLFVFGAAVFSVDIYSNFWNLLVIILLSSAAATSFGMFLAAIARTAAQVQGLSTLLILSMSAVGGSWFPVSFMPSYIQVISKFTLTYWSVEGFLDVLWRNVGFMKLLPNVGVLAFIAVALTAISVWKFQKREAW